MTTGFCFDLDGTLSTLEILPCIAAELDIADEIATLTRLTMDGHIPFADSMRLRTLILGQVPISRVHEIIESIPLEPALVEFIQSCPDQCFVVTGNLDVWIQPLIQRLSCGWFSSNAELINGRLCLNHILDKGQAIRDLRVNRGFKKIVAVGDGANDVPMLKGADVSIAYGGVHTPASTTIAASHLIVNSPDSLCTLLKAL